MLADSVDRALDIQAYLAGKGLAVPLCRTNSGENRAALPGDDRRFIVVSDFIDGDTSFAPDDAEAAGALTARMHAAMRDYPGALPAADRRYYIDRYVSILRGRRYPRADEFAELGDRLWERVRGLPTGYCHGDLYDGNIMRSADGRMYALDFDTSSIGFPIYDAVVYCNRTDYFRYDMSGYYRTQELLDRFMEAYAPEAQGCAELELWPELIAVYHFALQANIVELFGPHCVDEAFIGNQLTWLERWRAQALPCV